MLRWLVKGQIRLSYVPEVMVRMRVGGESNRSIGRLPPKKPRRTIAPCADIG